MHVGTRMGAALLLCGALTLPARSLDAQQVAPVSISFESSEMKDVLSFFAEYAHRSIVAGVGVGGFVTAKIDRQPWDAALAAILDAHGFVGRELANGIIVVEDPRSVVETPGPLVTRVFRLNYVPAAELQAVVASVLSKRGTVSALATMNALIVTDEPRVIDKVAALLISPPDR